MVVAEGSNGRGGPGSGVAVVAGAEQIRIVLSDLRRFVQQWSDPFTHNCSDDLVQEAALATWQAARHLRRPERAPAFARTVARRTRSHWLQAQARRPALSVDELRVDAGARPRLGSDVILIGDRRVPVHRLCDELRELLCRLPLLSAVVVQGFYRGVSVAELAARYGIGVDSVKKRLFRSRQVLRNWLETRVAGAGFEDGA